MMAKLFKNVEELKELLNELQYEGTVVLENPSYLDAIIGITDEGAMEFIDYNTIRALPYASSMGVRPIVVYNDFFKEE